MSESTESSEQVERVSLDLQAYFDGEMDAAERERFEAQFEQDAELKRELGDLGVMRELVVGGLDAEAKDVPEARFEQIWDEIDATLDRESRLQEAAGTRPSLWARVLPFFRPAALPVAAAAAAAAFVVIVVNQTGDPSGAGANTEQPIASEDSVGDQATAPNAETPDSEQPAPDDRMADATAPTDPAAPVEFEAPESNDADVDNIEFGGHNGRIERLESSRGTTTVIWIEEDDEPVDSERSL
jgi:negative regulator of sigma E activity